MKPEKKAKPLSAQHKRFIAAYRRLRNATRAYAEVYPRASHSTCDSNGSHLMADDRIYQEIERLDNDALRRAHMGPDEVLAESGRIARNDYAMYLWAPGELDADGNATVAGTHKPLHEMTPEVRRTIKTIKRDILGNIEIVPWDKTAQLGNIMRHHKLLTDKIELGVDASFGDLLEEARRKLEGK